MEETDRRTDSIEEPYCCGEPMKAVGAGRHRAGFEIRVWRCPNCERYKTKSHRVDGQTFWVGAMGRAIQGEEARIIADHGRVADRDDYGLH